MNVSRNGSIPGGPSPDQLREILFAFERERLPFYWLHE